MAVLSWGKPEIEICKLVNGELPETPTWIKIPTPVQDTTTLETEDGDKTEAIEEGGAVVDVYRKVSKFTFKFTLFKKKGENSIIPDDNGIITDNYAFRLTPEDKSCDGLIAKKCNVSKSITYSAADGLREAFTFDVIKDSTGKMIDYYTAPVP